MEDYVGEVLAVLAGIVDLLAAMVSPEVRDPLLVMAVMLLSMTTVSIVQKKFD